MKTLTRHTKKEAKKSTSSHSTKVAKKSVKAIKKIKPLSIEFQASTYNKKTIDAVYSVGNSFLKANEKFEKNSTAMFVELANLSVSLIKQLADKGTLVEKIKMRKVIYHFVKYDTKVKEIKSFEVGVGRILDKAFKVIENKGWSIDDKTAQLLDEKGKVVSIRELEAMRKASGKVATRPNATGSKQTQKQISVDDMIKSLIASKTEIKNADVSKVKELHDILQDILFGGVVEEKEEPNKHMKIIGETKLPKNAFGKSQLNQAVSNQ